MGLFIEQSSFSNLRLYKYSSEDHSVISKYVLKKWWNNFVKIFPLSMAPNVITLLGLVFILVDLAVVFYYDPQLNATSPRWCYFFYAFGLFMYQTFDGCDGCHARRTQQSGPLGELFDHSVDAINTTLSVIVFASVFKLGYSWLLLLAQFASLCNFYTSTWEEYHTHTLYLSQFSGPVEGILIIIALYVFTGVVGPDIWQSSFQLDLEIFGVNRPVEVPLNLLYQVFGLCALYFNIASAMGNVYKKYKKDIADSEKSKSEINQAYKGLLPFFAYYLSVVVYTWSFPTLVTDYGFPLVISIGLTMAFTVGRIILAHLTKTEFPMVQFPMFVPTIQLVVSKILIHVYSMEEQKVLDSVSWLGCGIVMGIHIIFVSEIIYEITTYLDIYALSIKHKKA
ncbi:Piso0_005276 [Millerozyma farinosa CBS 7064]|uniref:diacylglycerol cholinephosphotransferase n=1 Tax=Pichia sorbitophila (strain ATCC MYA-4447 / BCRC 22081 / CBS 7064 / NBRC 10061 / NRRL Y-12695) TaxID=559304 RepID=G8Y1R3_PICSO|nr:Piso0_005276 [Millerozyma farinosa CBS 7064]